MRGVGGVLVASLLAACAGAPPTQVLSKDDPFRPYREIESAPYRLAVAPGHVILRLVAQIDRGNGAVVLLVKVQHSYVGRHRNSYEMARNARAQELPLAVVARYGQCRVRTDCPIDELYTVQVPEADLRAAGSAGYAFKVFAKVGPDVLITVPAVMIANLLAELDVTRKGRPAETASVPPAKAR